MEASKLEEACVVVKSLEEDLQFAHKKEIPQRLMNLLKGCIACFLEKHESPQFLASIDRFYDKLASLLKLILKTLIQTHDAGDLKRAEENEVVSRMCVYLGEVLEHREKTALSHHLPKNLRNVQQASNFYLKAINTHPHVGGFYSRLAELTAFNGDLFSACYWAMRAETCEQPEERNEILAKKLAEQTEETKKRAKLEFKDANEGLMSLSLHLVAYHNQKSA